MDAECTRSYQRYEWMGGWNIQYNIIIHSEQNFQDVDESHLLLVFIQMSGCSRMCICGKILYKALIDISQCNILFHSMEVFGSSCLWYLLTTLNTHTQHDRHTWWVLCQVELVINYWLWHQTHNSFIVVHHIFLHVIILQCMYGWMTVYNAIDLWMTVHTWIVGNRILITL